MRFQSLFLWSLTAVLTACSAGQIATPTRAAPTPAPALSQPTAETAPQPVHPTAALPVPTVTVRPLSLDAADWQHWSVIPTLSPEMLTIYKSGQALQRDTHVVSVVGDCESSSD
ncbi:MAG TPA: hypothetical protein VLE49_07150, partial [Anaerolineales bacterium]|nr:hypothetical protein [Anaerolineales bacterium]